MDIIYRYTHDLRKGRYHLEYTEFNQGKYYVYVHGDVPFDIIEKLVETETTLSTELILSLSEAYRNKYCNFIFFAGVHNSGFFRLF